jgi:predicted HicB family RNase H-like nuclease
MTAMTPEQTPQVEPTDAEPWDLEKEIRVREAVARFFQTSPDWVSFYRQVLGLKGVVRRNYPDQQAMARFMQTPTYLEIHSMLTTLRKMGSPPDPTQDPLQVITVRIPKSLHDALQTEAFDHHTSMNKLCISKLLQFIDAAMVPKQTPE